MKRVLALAVACLLIAAALAARSAVGDDSDDDDGDADGGSNGGDLVIACIPELENACEAIDRDLADLRIEDPDATIADPDVDAWITLDPWPEIAEMQAGREIFGPAVAVAQTDLVLIAREAQVPPGCDPVAWSCLVDALGDRVALANPATAAALLLLGHAAIDFFGDPALVSNDFSDPALADRLAALGIGGDPLDDVRIGLPEPSATGALEVQLALFGSRLDQFVMAPGRFPATVAVVVAGRDADRVASERSFTDALAELGWDVDPGSATTGLPNPGVLLALAQEVR
jgi:hypothetical protein